MKLRKLKRIVCCKICLSIFWRKQMYSVHRVRITPDKQVIPVYPNEIITPPDFEMWAVYKNGTDSPVSLHLTFEEAQAASEVFNQLIKSKLKPKF